jgi:hypothetical protein
LKRGVPSRRIIPAGRYPDARTWKDYHYDLRQFADLVGDVPLATLTFCEVDRFVDLQKMRSFLPTTEGTVLLESNQSAQVRPSIGQSIVLAILCSLLLPYRRSKMR